MKTSLINNCLIGYTGFIGSTILSQNPFKYVFNSSNIAEIKNKEFDLVLCSAAPAQKWIANKYPDKDKKNLELLTSYLETIKCKKFILISTVDVFAIPIDVDENSKINESNLLPYGLNRRLLEKFATSNFKENMIVRLPGLVGTGLKKNIIFDFINSNNTHLIDSRSIFQFYPMAKLWQDINIALKNNLSLIHLTSEPLSIKEIALKALDLNFENHLDKPCAHYDMQTRYSNFFNDSNIRYQYTKEESLQAIMSYSRNHSNKL